MSTLMQQDNLRSSRQSSVQKKRPSHNLPKNLSQDEIQCLCNLLGNDYVTLATAVAQILHGCNHIWKKQACGVLCFIKDYNRRVYCFRLYNLRSKELIYEEITSAAVCLEKVSDLFYTFDGMKCKVGINFVDHIEAETFCKHFHEKQEDLRKKMKDQKSTNTHKTSMSAMMNVIKAPSNDSVKTPIPASVSEKPVKSKALGYDKKKHSRPVISKPVESSFVHVIHVAHEQSFVKDNTKKQLFEQVLTGMQMSPEEELYVRSTVKNTDPGLEKLFTKSTSDCDTQRQQITDSPPAIPPRTYSPIQRNNRNHIPYQDISMPSVTFHETSKNHPPLQNTDNTSTDSKQLTAPVVPPRPARSVPNNTQQSIKTSRAPPPPIPTETENFGVPLPPPPPPPPPPFPPPTQTFLSEPMTNESPTSSLNPEENSFLKEIINFKADNLKPASQRPVTSIKPIENKSNLNVQQTIEENIRVMLDKRRGDIMGRDDDEDDDDESDSNDDEWYE